MLYDPQRRWQDAPGRPCMTVDDPEMFHPPADGRVGNGPAVPSRQRRLDAAKALCRTCPVMHQCRRDTWGEEEGVWGGTDEWERARFRRAVSARMSKWPPARRRAWAAECYHLWHSVHPQTWREVRRKCGLPQSVAEVLVREHTELLAQQAEEKAARKVESATRASREAERALGGLTVQSLPRMRGGGHDSVTTAA